MTGRVDAWARGRMTVAMLTVATCAYAPMRLCAQTPADSAAWRHVMAVQVAQFLHHEAPHGGITLQSADSTDSRDWSTGFLLEVSHLYDSLKRTSPPGDSAQGGKVTFSPLMSFEQPYGGIPRQLLQLLMTESICIESPGGGRYYSGQTYTVRLFTRGRSFFADVNFLETPDGMCS